MLYLPTGNDIIRMHIEQLANELPRLQTLHT